MNLSIDATDGAIGDVKELYFGGGAWTIRYLVVETGSWLAQPHSADLTRCRRQPRLGPFGLGSVAAAHPEALQRDQGAHLHSCKAIVESAVVACDGEIGRLQGLIVDEDGGSIRDLVVSASDWWLGHDVLVAPQWNERAGWSDRTVSVALTREALQQAPWYNPALPLARAMEIWPICLAQATTAPHRTMRGR